MPRLACKPSLGVGRGGSEADIDLDLGVHTHMITLEEVTTLVRRELRGKLQDGTQLDRDTRLEDLGLSSLQVAEIVFTLEEEHEVEFDASRAADVQTLGDVVDVANEALAEVGGVPAREADDAGVISESQYTAS